MINITNSASTKLEMKPFRFDSHEIYTKRKGLSNKAFEWTLK